MYPADAGEAPLKPPLQHACMMQAQQNARKPPFVLLQGQATASKISAGCSAAWVLATQVLYGAYAPERAQ
jgi:hypothetical protein